MMFVFPIVIVALAPLCGAFNIPHVVLPKKFLMNSRHSFVDEAKDVMSKVSKDPADIAYNLAVQTQAFNNVYFVLMTENLEAKHKFQCKEQSYFENMSFMAQRYRPMLLC